MSRERPRVCALVSAGAHPVSGRARACRADAVAMAVGRRLAGDGLRVLHAGTTAEPALQDYLALGAGTVEVVPLAPGEDAASHLAAQLQDTAIVLTGARAECGAGSGLLPYLLAKSLGRPVIANVLEVKLSAEEAEVVQFLPKGRRRRLACRLPAVVIVHPLAPVSLSYAFARKVSGGITEAPAATEAPGNAISPAPAWSDPSADRQPVRLKAAEKRPAHARLQSAIAPEAKSGVVVIEGSHVGKAQVVLDYLRHHRLIDF